MEMKKNSCLHLTASRSSILLKYLMVRCRGDGFSYLYPDYLAVRSVPLANCGIGLSTSRPSLVQLLTS
jgi:hypothetical protein